MAENLFTYHFQPIISARNGEVLAYEALMRTGPDIGMNPLEILDIAWKHNRLYDIEYATIKNTSKILNDNIEVFKNKKLFINCIPAHMLSAKDFNEIHSVYALLWERIVVEMTEQTEMADESLNEVITRVRNSNAKLAIDDFGTGYSNTSRLLAFNPDYVKLDRTLINNINSDRKKQNVVKGLVDFIHANGGLVLGEGVETKSELETLIDLGCDLFQGYYVARPAPEFLLEVSQELKDEIVRINLEAASDIKRNYQAKSGEIINSKFLVDEGITDVFFENGKYTLVGTPEHIMPSAISVKENSTCEITFKNLSMFPESGRPAITVGKGSFVKLYVEGENSIKKSGIYVPEGSSFYLGGNGNLTIVNENRDCYGIGTESRMAAGNITIDHGGRLFLVTNGEYCTAIGGGLSGGNIDIKCGDIKITGSGTNCLGIGSIYGKTPVSIGSCHLDVDYSAANSCCIGSMEGFAKVSLSNMSFETNSSGRFFCGIGSLNGSGADIDISKASVSIDMRGKQIMDIGCFDGDVNCNIDNTTLMLYSEGEKTGGIGSPKGKGRVRLEDTSMKLKFLSGDGFGIGTSDHEAEVVRGDLKIDINA